MNKHKEKETKQAFQSYLWPEKKLQWCSLLDWVKQSLLSKGYINNVDLKLAQVVEPSKVSVGTLDNFYQKSAPKPNF